MTILFYFLTQILFSVAVIVVFGLVIALCRRIFCRMTGGTGRKILLATGIVGTPIHELSHAAMCLLFGHRITEIKLYQPSAPDGTLGYVSHSFNSKNLYQQIGNFFIGVAPILGGSGALFLLMRGLVPMLLSEVATELQSVTLFSGEFLTVFVDYFGSLREIVLMIITHVSGGNGWSWVFLVLALMIANHMELSGADIKSGFAGFVFLSLGLLATDAILFFVSQPTLDNMTAAMTSFSAWIVGFLTFSLIFSLLLVFIGLIILLLKKVLLRTGR